LLRGEINDNNSTADLLKEHKELLLQEKGAYK